MKPRSFHPARRRVVAGTATLFCASLLLLHSAGCGGGGEKKATVETGAQSGSVSTVEITPSPGTVFIGRSTTFQLAWTHNAPPPTFTAVLVRYKTEDGGSASEQRTTLTRRGDSYVWDLKRDGDYDLEAPGVYYIELTNGAENYRAAYIVSRDRSVPITKTAEAAPSGTQSASPTTDGETTTVHSVSVSPTP